MNKREARVYALCIVKEMIWAEVRSPTGLTMYDALGEGMFRELGLETHEDTDKLHEAMLQIADLLSDKIERSGIELPGVTAG